LVDEPDDHRDNIVNSNTGIYRNAKSTPNGLDHVLTIVRTSESGVIFGSPIHRFKLSGQLNVRFDGNLSVLPPLLRAIPQNMGLPVPQARITDTLQPIHKVFELIVREFAYVWNADVIASGIRAYHNGSKFVPLCLEIEGVNLVLSNQSFRLASLFVELVAELLEQITNLH
jgi:hypothetical protein